MRPATPDSPAIPDTAAIPAQIAYLTGLDEPNTADTGGRPNVSVLHRGDTETLIRLAFRGGQELPDHTTAHPIVVLGQSGRIAFTVAGTTYELAPGRAVRVDARVPHSLRAAADATATLIMVHGK